MQQIDFSSLLSTASPKSLLAYFFAIVVSLVFAVIFNLIYQLYSYRNNSGIGVNKSFALIAPAVTAIFLVIQFSLPLSLGLLGALSFVRFRTPIKEPEEIGFLLVIIASGLSCAVFRFEVSLMLAIVLLALALLRQKSFVAQRLFRGVRFCELFIVSNDSNNSQQNVLESVIEIFKKKNLPSKLLSVSNAEGLVSYHMRISQQPQTLDVPHLVSEIKKLTSVSNVNVIFNES